ncbi:MAG: DJ-1/PfpI family protein [Duodenibacillus sp.]
MSKQAKKSLGPKTETEKKKVAPKAETENKVRKVPEIVHINCVVFDDFETLDLFGPVEVLGKVEGVKVRMYSRKGGVVTSRQGTKIKTKPFSDMKKGGVVLLPGGQGTRALVDDAKWIAAFKSVAEQSRWCLTVCTGSALLAKTGLLNGLKATSNKKALGWTVEASGTDQTVQWQKKARWCVDGKYYTSSGVSAGIDMALGFVSDRLGVMQAQQIADHIEYLWNRDAERDPFAPKEA